MIAHAAHARVAIIAALSLGAATFAAVPISAQDSLVRVRLDYRAPAGGTHPNFSPKGTVVALTPVTHATTLPRGAVLPARTGAIQLGPVGVPPIPVMMAAVAGDSHELVQLYIDRNRNHDFDDDGPPRRGVVSQNPKTHAWWTSIDSVTLAVRFAGINQPEPYQISVWLVRDDSAGPPDQLRYSVRSWRFGTVMVGGVPALVAMMDADNNAVFNREDTWCVFPADSAGAASAVLSIAEARTTNRLMFLPGPEHEQVLGFRDVTPDGSSMRFAVIDRPVTKAQDRAPDDLVREERVRPRTSTPVVWRHGHLGLDSALTIARTQGHRVLLDFEATWCGPCHTMDQWVWSDAQVADTINAGYVGVKIDVDLEPGLVKRFHTKGYPTMILLDRNGQELSRVEGYQSSRQMLDLLSH